MATPPAEVPQPSASEDARTHGPDMAKVRAAIRGGMLAYFVDQFDIYLPIVTLAPAMIYFQAADLSKGTVALLASLVFASTLIGRPLGAIIFGHFADTVGRKRTTLVAVGGFGITTLVIACLPGHETIGSLSIFLLIALRFIDGVFLGGEYTTAVPLAMEWSPKQRRGLYASLITSTSPWAYAVIAAITLLMLNLVSAEGLHSAYVQWGWRIPFVIGTLLSIVLFRYYLRQVHEPPAEVTGEVYKAPFIQLIRRYPKSFGQVFIMMTGLWLATNTEAQVMPALLKEHLELSSKQVSAAMLFVNIAAAIAFVVFGVLAQRIGRRIFYIWYGPAVLVIGSGAFALLMTAKGGFAVAVVLSMLFAVFTVGAFGPIAAYLTERFPASIRSTGYGVGYSLAIILPAFYEFYLGGLSGMGMAPYLAPVVLVVAAGILMCLGGFLGPETKDIDMTDESTIPSLS